MASSRAPEASSGPPSDQGGATPRSSNGSTATPAAGKHREKRRPEPLDLSVKSAGILPAGSRPFSYDFKGAGQQQQALSAPHAGTGSGAGHPFAPVQLGVPGHSATTLETPRFIWDETTVALAKRLHFGVARGLFGHGVAASLAADSPPVTPRTPGSASHLFLPQPGYLARPRLAAESPLVRPQLEGRRSSSSDSLTKPVERAKPVSHPASSSLSSAGDQASCFQYGQKPAGGERSPVINVTGESQSSNELPSRSSNSSNSSAPPLTPTCSLSVATAELHKIQLDSPATAARPPASGTIPVQPSSVESVPQPTSGGGLSVNYLSVSVAHSQSGTLETPTLVSPLSLKPGSVSSSMCFLPSPTLSPMSATFLNGDLLSPFAFLAGSGLAPANTSNQMGAPVPQAETSQQAPHTRLTQEQVAQMAPLVTCARDKVGAHVEADEPMDLEPALPRILVVPEQQHQPAGLKAEPNHQLYWHQSPQPLPVQQRLQREPVPKRAMSPNSFQARVADYKSDRLESYSAPPNGYLAGQPRARPKLKVASGPVHEPVEATPHFRPHQALYLEPYCVGGSPCAGGRGRPNSADVSQMYAGGAPLAAPGELRHAHSVGGRPRPGAFACCGSASVDELHRQASAHELGGSALHLDSAGGYAFGPAVGQPSQQLAPPSTTRAASAEMPLSSRSPVLSLAGSGLELQLRASSAGATRKYHCDRCPKAFTRSDMLTRHKRLHSGDRPFKCDQCKQEFSRSDHLSTHVRTHTGEKPYKCLECNYSACRRDMITRHMKVHNKSSVQAAGRPTQTAPSSTSSGFS